MKRSLFLALLFVFTLVMNAQSWGGINGKRILYIHVYHEYEGKFRDQVSIDYGFNNHLHAQGKDSKKITDKNGNPLLFRTKLSLVNYMTLQGWTLMDNTDDIFNISYWLTFAKEVTEEEANEFISKLATPKTESPGK